MSKRVLDEITFKLVLLLCASSILVGWFRDETEALLGGAMGLICGLLGYAEGSLSTWKQDKKIIEGQREQINALLSSRKGDSHE